jgi:Rps23 Pro-64 3,4-dihydroxylase Tpa1-like proline 4-hydroxylase
VACDEFDRAADTSVLARFVDFLSADTFLEFARDVSGAQDIQRVSAQATCLRAGYFCGFHTDTDYEDKVRVSCVFGFTPQWRQEWGGLLQFKGENGGLQDFHVPGFNSMSIFKANQVHGVSVVSARAEGARYSITAVLMAN